MDGISIEPPAKKIKVENSTDSIDQCIERIKNRQTSLNCVLEDSLFQQVPTVKIYSGHIKDPKNISKAIAVLNERLPLKELAHLKRVCKRNILLCPVTFLNGVPSIQEYMEHNLEELKDMFDYFTVLHVPSSAPLLYSHFKECSKLWSCNYHPNHYLEKLVDGTIFNSVEDASHTKFMLMAFEVARWHITDADYDMSCVNAAVVVDPARHSVVAAAYDDRKNHPIKHAAMLAIDNVAKTQNGGAWPTDDSRTAVTLRGLDEDLMVCLQKKFPVDFGAKEPGPDGPYLCTGYYMYLIREPCLMCAMALVHARVKRVFFSIHNKTIGALKSRTKLQTVSSLNHHFEVFTGFL